MQDSKNLEKLEIIEILRGLASLAVAWFHYTNGNPEFLESGWLKLSGKYGWLGVEVFFVVSGFIIPYSLWRSNFQLNLHWQKFFAKRAIRIYPAYLVTIFLIISFKIISFFSPNLQSEAVIIDFKNVFLHLGFLNGIFHEPWLENVFWTLGIEFQYYLLIIFIYPLLISSDLRIKLLILLILCELPIAFRDDSLIFSWLLLFVFGILAFQLIIKKITLIQYGIMIFLVAILTYFNKELLVAFIGLATSILIAFVRSPKIMIFGFLGEISYALYLLHSTIGGKITYLVLLLGEGFMMKFLSLILALTISIYTSYLMYKYIEKPAQKFFGTIKYSS